MQAAAPYLPCEGLGGLQGEVFFFFKYFIVDMTLFHGLQAEQVI